MRIAAPLLLASLSGCFYIGAKDEDSRLAWLDSAAPDTDDTDTAVGGAFVLDDVDPTVFSACDDSVVLNVEGHVDDEFGGATFTTLLAWDGESFETVDSTQAQDAFEGAARVSYTLDVPFPDVLESCTGDWCDHALALGLSGPAELQAAVEGGVRVVGNHPPTLAAVAVVDGAGAATALADATPVASPPGALLVGQWPKLAIGLDAPFVAAGGEAAYAVEVWSCPGDVIGPDCTVATGTADAAVVDGDLVFTVETSTFGADGCAEAAPRHLVARVTGDPCAASIDLPLGDARFAAPDCDQDGKAAPADCDDEDADVYPGADEVCDGFDDDCDGDVDDADADLVATQYFDDTDDDGLGDPATARDWCKQPSGWVLDGTDCDDGDASVTGPVPWFEDKDGDGLGNAAVTKDACQAPAKYVSDNTDCNDTTAAVGGPTRWYQDADGDGYGVTKVSQSACIQPSGYVTKLEDCKDGDKTVYPGAAEHCDGVDEDCSGTVDDKAVDAQTFYLDTDGDKYGDTATTLSACSLPSGYADKGGDCRLTDAASNPGAAEFCSVAQMLAGTDVDNDCDGKTDAIDCGTCTDTQLSAPIGETDIDCGGQCDLGCSVAQTCKLDDDCSTSDCDATGHCQVWARVWQGSNFEVGTHVAVAPNGDIVVVGTTDSPTVDVDATPNSGGLDFVVARYAADGTLKWGRMIGGSGNDRAGDVTTDAQGNVYVVGSYEGVVLDGFPVGNKGGSDVFVLKLDPSGTSIAAAAYGTSADDLAHAVVLDGSGRPVIGGRSGNLGGPTTAESGFVAVLDATGAVARLTRFDGTLAGDRVTALALHPSGDLLVGGSYGASGVGRSSVDVTTGASTVTYQSAVTGTDRDGFVARLSATDGSVTWFKGVEGLLGQDVFDLAALANGDVLVGGRFEGNSTKVSTASQLLSSNGGLDAFLSRLGGVDGAHQWSKAWGSTGQDGVASIVVGPGNRPIVGYWYGGNHDTDPSATTRNVVGAGASDAALSVFDANGAWQSGATYVDPGYWGPDYDGSIALDLAANAATGQVVLGGALDGWVDVGDGRKKDTLSGPGMTGLFVASLGPAGWASSVQRDGFDASRAAVDCRTLRTDFPTLVSGTYTLDPNGGSSSDALPAYCEMSLEGGGWTRIVTQIASEQRIVCMPATSVAHQYEYATAVGTPADVASRAHSAWWSPTQVAQLPFTDRSVMIVLDTSSVVRPHPYNVYRSSNTGFTWTAIANGQVTPATVATLGVKIVANGHPEQAMIGHGSNTLPLSGLFFDGTTNRDAMAVGAGLECRGDAPGLWSGTDPESLLTGGSGAGGQWFPGSIYVR